MSLKTDKRVIDALNTILTGELTAINQYFLHAKMCQNWGYERLYKVIYGESIDEMKHADALIERILFLGGLPNVQRLDNVNIGETVAEQLQADLAFEHIAIPRLKEAIDLCYTCADHGTRTLLEKILSSEEEHVDWLEAQLELIEQIGIQNYLAQQLYA
ncbi:MAG: bacterioferritin [Myxococcota bacterium]|nr:bacterioferritin [Myxococcota bacterium]